MVTIYCLSVDRSKLRVEDMKEVQQALKEAQWADDREVTHCKQCEKAFSVSRRKVCVDALWPNVYKNSYLNGSLYVGFMWLSILPAKLSDELFVMFHFFHLKDKW